MLDVSDTRRPVPTVPPTAGVLGAEMLAWDAACETRSLALGITATLLVVLGVGLITSARAALRVLGADDVDRWMLSVDRGADWLAARNETESDLSPRSGSFMP